MSSIKFYQPTTLVSGSTLGLTTSLNSLASGNSVLSTAYDNTSGTGPADMWANFELDVSYTITAPAVGTAVANLYLLPSLDGTNYATSSSGISTSPNTLSSSGTTVTASGSTFNSSAGFTASMLGWTITSGATTVTITTVSSITQVIVNNAPTWTSVTGIINNLPQKALMVGILESRNPVISGTNERLQVLGIPLPPTKFKLLLVNTSGVAFWSSGNVLTMQPYQMQAI